MAEVWIILLKLNLADLTVFAQNHQIKFPPNLIESATTSTKLKSKIMLYFQHNYRFFPAHDNSRLANAKHLKFRYGGSPQ